LVIDEIHVVFLTPRAVSNNVMNESHKWYYIS